MINEHELDYVDMSDEEILELNLSNEKLVEIYTEKSVIAAKMTLEMDERCFQKFGIKQLPDEQRAVFQKIAARLDVSDEEMQVLQDAQISSRMELIEMAREDEIEKSAALGEQYEPIITFQDRTDGYAVN